MTERSTIERVIREGYTARQRGDAHAQMDALTANATFRIAGSQELFPIPMKAEGADQLRASFERLNAEFAFLNLDLRTCLIEGDNAALHWDIRMRHNKSNTAFDMELGHLLRFEGDRIASLVEFGDTARASRFLSSKPPPIAAARPDRSAIAAVIDAGYDARQKGDAAALAHMFGGYFSMRNAPGGFPADTTASGERALRETFARLIDAFTFLEREKLALIVDGNRAAAHSRVRARHNPSGKTFDTELFDFWVIENGRVASLVQFCDTALLESL